MDHILFWNPRGAGGKDFQSAITDIVKMNNVDCLIICEPKVQFASAEKHLLQLGFTDYAVAEATGFSGGIWMLWKNGNFQVELIDSNFQSITVQVSWNGIQSWLLTGIYASPCKSSRRALWNYLAHLHAAVQLPWILIGDLMRLSLLLIKMEALMLGSLEDCKIGFKEMG